MADPYEVLGVPRDASPDDIKKAYRRLARQYHPDANPGDAEAEARFKEISAAHEILADPDKRARYDRFGSTGGPGGGPGAADFGSVQDLFDAFFGGGSPFGAQTRTGPPRGVDLEVAVPVDFVDAVFGAEIDVEVRTAVRCETCDGSGAAPGTEPITCLRCSGTGQIRQVRQSLLGQMVTAAACPDCDGTGQKIPEPCPACNGEGRTITDMNYQVKVPAGVDDGATLRLTGRGAVGARGGAAGDLYVHLRVGAHDRFVRRGVDLHEELAVPFTQATLGAVLPYETLEDETEITVAPGTESGDTVRLRGKGVPRLEGRGRGDLIVTLRVETPTDLDEAQVDLVRQLADLRGEEVQPPDGGLLGRIRSVLR